MELAIDLYKESVEGSVMDALLERQVRLMKALDVKAHRAVLSAEQRDRFYEEIRNQPRLTGGGSGWADTRKQRYHALDIETHEPVAGGS